MQFRHELVMPTQDLPFRLFLFEGKDGNYQVSQHWHHSLEIFLVLEGSIQFSINKTLYTIQREDFVIVNANEVHSIQAPFPNQTIVIQIPFSAFDGYVEKEQFLNFAKQEEQDNRKLIDVIKSMYEAYTSKQYGSLLQVKSNFYALLYLLLLTFSVQEMTKQEEHAKRQLDRLSDITQYLKEHYREELTLEAVADHFGFTPTYLSRIFHRYALVTYRSYVLDLRVQFARRELLNSNHSIAKIAVAHGFPDSRSFSKAYVKRYHCLPSEDRKLHTIE